MLLKKKKVFKALSAKIILLTIDYSLLRNIIIKKYMNTVTITKILSGYRVL